MISVAEAVARITGGIVPLEVEDVPLDVAPGRVLAAPAVARYTLPHRDNSAMDGYAVRAADLAAASPERPVVLRVLETVGAGALPTRAVGPGEASRIMTGAPIPEGADSVIRVEDTDAGLATVEVRDARDAGKNRRPRGEDFREGDLVLEAGAAIGAAQVGVLASLGMGRVPVHRRPEVAIVGSGDELVDLDRFDEVLAGRRIVSSNSYTLTALVRACGAVARPMGNAADTPASLRALVERAISGGVGAVGPCDLILTSAGASVGAFDYTRDVLASLGAELDFWKVKMRPGAPIGFGTLRGVPWIALPGNPVSAMVTFELFARPVIRRMLGHRRLFRRPVPVVLEEPVTIAAALTHFLRAIVSVGPDGVATARLTGPQGSGILTSMARANALLVVPEDRPAHAVGDRLGALLLSEDATLSESFAL